MIMNRNIFQSCSDSCGNFSLDNRCSNCLMPEHAVQLTSDKSSCSYCAPKEKRKDVTVGEDFIPNDNRGLTITDIKAMATSGANRPDKMAGINNQYDCLIGITGGRDSTFILYYVKKILGLNPLAVNFSSIFQTEEARHNMRDATSKLGIDFITYSMDSNYFRKLAQGFFVKYGEFCSPCHKGHHYTLAKFASDFGIKIIIRGISSKIDLNRMDSKYFNYFCKSEDEFNDRISNIACEFNITQEELDRHYKLNHLQTWKDKSILTIDLPDLLEWQYDDIQKVLNKEFDWRYPNGQFFHCDCMLNPTLCYQEYCKHGYSEKQIVISNMLLSKDISLDQGREFLLSEEVSSVPKNIKEVLKCLDLDRKTFDDVINKFWKKNGENFDE
ncbi:MAG: hypothetical protein HQK51_12335 [Oligoflexia bacterium]|nr:hypothetical protein [Oligoflexia bacterium]